MTAKQDEYGDETVAGRPEPWEKAEEYLARIRELRSDGVQVSRDEVAAFIQETKAEAFDIALRIARQGPSEKSPDVNPEQANVAAMAYLEGVDKVFVDISEVMEAQLVEAAE